MRPYLLITIDAESDDLWARRAELTFENIGAMPRLQEFFERHGVRPTWLVTYPVATSEIGRHVFGEIARRGSAEIGSHMHVWTTPPLAPLTPNDHKYCPLASEISYEQQYEKMLNVTRAVGELAGAAPRAYRAGRYALDGNGLRVLEALGYTVDTSVTPLLSWREPGHDGGWRGPDFTRAPLEPYHPANEDLTRAGASPILEVPVSFFLTRPLPSGLARWLVRLPRNNNLVRALRWSGVVRHSWLRPGREVSGRTLAGVARALIAAGIPVLNVMFHSSEMAAGTSPHTKTQAQVEESYEQLDYLFRAAIGGMGAQPMTLSEFAAAHAAAQPAAPPLADSHARG
ncbi:MAG: polysaccharide deacetylase family protein [Acidobacteria bacterium]|nr:polysaccharide deacetylase family protein [Acidobacteriota bacterium]MBI3661916.1 polysaccharide deacetylase family protein [Acidobacteriota bacterium]